MMECHPAEPRFRTWRSSGSLVGFVVSLNLRRRHLTASQRACVGVEMLPGLEKEARERMAEGGKGRENIPDPGRARDKAAQIVGVNPHYVSDAKKLKEERPEVFQEVRAIANRCSDV